MEETKNVLSPEEMKNGVISEEALSEIAGGTGIDKLTLAEILKGAGVGVWSMTKSVAKGVAIGAGAAGGLVAASVLGTYALSKTETGKK